jgi:hypothetical protein
LPGRGCRSGSFEPPISRKFAEATIRFTDNLLHCERPTG